MMIVFNLHCENDHRFEGWFGGHDAFELQKERSLIECPLCGSKQIEKMLSAPRIHRGLSSCPSDADSAASQATKLVAQGQSPGAIATGQHHAQSVALQLAWLQMARYVVENTEDVGREFAEEARRMHYQETPERGIRGQASEEEAQALAEEGIEILSISLPAALKGPVQ